MKKVFIIHGFEGSPNGGWRGWLMDQLEHKDVYAYSCIMPNPEAPTQHEWVEALHSQINFTNKNDELYLVGHSLGATTILRYLQTYTDSRIKGCILVSGPIKHTQNNQIANFFSTDFMWEKIKASCKFAVIHGDDDPYVPLEHATTLKKELGEASKLHIIPEGKHLNGSAGFRTLPEVIGVIDRFLYEKFIVTDTLHIFEQPAAWKYIPILNEKVFQNSKRRMGEYICSSNYRED